MSKSSRRLQSSLREAVEQGYLGSVRLHGSSAGSGIDSTPSAVMSDYLKFNTVSESMRSEWLTPLLLELVSVAAVPLRDLETVFAVDATGLSTRIYGRWLVEKPGGDSEDQSLDEPGEEAPVQADTDAGSEVSDDDEKERHDWMKLHALYGATTKTIVRAAVSSSRGADNSFFPGLVSEARRVGFNIERLAADKAYSDENNYNLADELGFRLLVPFRKNSLPPSDDSAWSRALKYSLQFPEEFWRDYFVRNISEAGFSAIKRLFTAPLLSKSYTGLVNEALCRVIAYNLIVLAREMRKGEIELNVPAEAMALVGSINEVIEMR
ncbi:MAG: transposase [Chloroflexi bacterium]|nr:transposase [Chloroflexota bacterium]